VHGARTELDGIVVGPYVQLPTLDTPLLRRLHVWGADHLVMKNVHVHPQERDIIKSLHRVMPDMRSTQGVAVTPGGCRVLTSNEVRFAVAIC
jgi:hypothetical protein